LIIVGCGEDGERKNNVGGEVEGEVEKVQRGSQIMSIRAEQRKNGFPIGVKD